MTVLSEPVPRYGPKARLAYAKRRRSVARRRMFNETYPNPFLDPQNIAH